MDKIKNLGYEYTKNCFVYNAFVMNVVLLLMGLI